MDELANFRILALILAKNHNSLMAGKKLRIATIVAQ